MRQWEDYQRRPASAWPKWAAVVLAIGIATAGGMAFWRHRARRGPPALPPAGASAVSSGTVAQAPLAQQIPGLSSGTIPAGGSLNGCLTQAGLTPVQAAA